MWKPEGTLIDDEDGEEVYITDEKSDEPCILAFNEGGHNFTTVSVTDVLDWVKANRPDLLKEAK